MSKKTNTPPPIKSTSKHYTVEKHTQILISLLKAHGIKKIVASPGTTNVTFIASLQSDPFFEIYSSIDERSAAYIALGLAAESGEIVALSCTGATASRNYLPGLTEAYYRKLPVLAITSSQYLGKIGQNCSQTIDRSRFPNDIVMESVSVDVPYTKDDEWLCAVNVNKAIAALKRRGGGPSHINLVTTYNRDYSAKKLPAVKVIKIVENLNEMPSIEDFKHIAILVGAHVPFSEELFKSIEDFCKAYNAVVVMNHASNYKGDFGYNPGLVSAMKQYSLEIPKADLVIYIGSISRYGSGMAEKAMWRVNPDGMIRDIEKKLTHVFSMHEEDFFRYYTDEKKKAPLSLGSSSYASQWQKEREGILKKIPELPFSNVFVAKTLSAMFPENCVFHLAGSNTARSWNFFDIPKSVICFSNDGTMGIDGQVSAMVGESLASPKKLHFGAVGDLTFFYDMNSIGNRHIGNNFRLLVVNNGLGQEMRLYTSPAGSVFGDDVRPYMSAAGHFGNKSKNLLHHYAEDLGFEYLCAENKKDFLESAKRFMTPEFTEKPMLFEVFTESKDETDAIYIMNHIVSSSKAKAKDLAKNVVKSVAGEKGISVVKNLLKSSKTKC